jgi:cytochrome P450
VFSAKDPYGEIAEARRHGAVVPYVSPSGGGGFFITRHAEAAEVLRDSSTYGTSFLSDSLGPLIGDDALVGQDGDAHRSRRQLLAHAIAGNATRAGHATAFRRIADEHVSGIVRKGSGDLIADLALAFPGRALAVSLGLPEAESPGLQAWAVRLLRNARDSTPDASMQELLAEQLLPTVTRARTDPGDDVLGRLVQAEVGGRTLTNEAVCSLAGFLLVAGLETFHRAVGNLLFALLTHPDQLEAVRGDPSLRNQAVEESLRWESPVTLTVRNTVTDSEIATVDLPAGTLLYVLLASANRDERRYTDPDDFDVFRPSKPHLTFGHGPHVCPGAGLSRTALRMLLDAVLDATTHIGLDTAAEPPSIRGDIFRSPEALFVRCQSAVAR